MDRLAEAVARAGHPGTLPQIRAEVFLGLLDGRLHGLTCEQIIETLLADAAHAGNDYGSDSDPGTGRTATDPAVARGGTRAGHRRPRGPAPDAFAEPTPSEATAGEPTAGEATAGEATAGEPTVAESSVAEPTPAQPAPAEPTHACCAVQTGSAEGRPDPAADESAVTQSRTSGFQNAAETATGTGTAPEPGADVEPNADVEPSADVGPAPGSESLGQGPGEGPADPDTGDPSSPSSPVPARVSPPTASAPACAASTAPLPAPQPEPPGASGPAPDEPPVEPAPAQQAVRCGVEIRVGLNTLLCLDQRPADLAGWGPVLPEVARRLVARQRHAEWRFALTDPDGHLVLAGATRRRPRTPRTAAGAAPAPPAQARGGIVELQIPATVLLHLAGHPELCGPWANVVADLARQYACRDQITATLHAHPDRRFLRAALRRHIQVRDRTCVAPGCRRPAAQADGDHTRDHATGGPSVPGNAGPLCRRHHRAKHHAGWRLHQPDPGRFVWTSPLGATYRTRGEAIWPPEPDSHPRVDTHDQDDDIDRQAATRSTTPSLDPTPPRRRRPPPAPPPEDDEPPF